MNAICIITARGGSKRIPGKNKKLFLGKPIICYSIEAAISSGIFEEVMVRSEAAANDFATTDDVLMEVLAAYEKIGKTFEYTACIYPTAPFVTAEKLKNALQILIENKASGVMPVVSFSFPPQRGMIVKNGKLQYCYPENAMKRSQDLEVVFHDCGQFYFYQTDKYLACKGDLPDGYVPLIMPETQVQDIDNASDWELAELKYKIMMQG